MNILYIPSERIMNKECMLKTSFWKEGGPTSIGDPVTTARVGVGTIKTNIMQFFHYIGLDSVVLPSKGFIILGEFKTDQTGDQLDAVIVLS